MTKRLLNIGLVSCLATIFLQIFAGFYELMQLKVLYLQYIVKGLDPLLNIIILIILWRVLVKFYKQSQLDNVLKVIIGISIALILLVFMGNLHLGRFVTISIIVLSIIVVIFYFIFLNRIVEIQASDIHQIDYLKNYAVAIVICFFGLFVLRMIIKINSIKGLD